mmetsp:Transcript_29328/g.101360  ORF Transcript_29328/g.101360 Transcript_29328/m.101360 type:complete len:204 (+) Transcript_29328:180-791(+)
MPCPRGRRGIANSRKVTLCRTGTIRNHPWRHSLVFRLGSRGTRWTLAWWTLYRGSSCCILCSGRRKIFQRSKWCRNSKWDSPTRRRPGTARTYWKPDWWTFAPAGNRSTHSCSSPRTSPPRTECTSGRRGPSRCTRRRTRGTRSRPGWSSRLCRTARMSSSRQSLRPFRRRTRCNESSSRRCYTFQRSSSGSRRLRWGRKSGR